MPAQSSRARSAARRSDCRSRRSARSLARRRSRDSRSSELVVDVLRRVVVGRGRVVAGRCALGAGVGATRSGGGGGGDALEDVEDGGVPNAEVDGADDGKPDTDG